MNRSHIYIIPESEIGSDVGLYDSFIRKYHRVEFVLSKEAYLEYKNLFPDFKVLYIDKPKPTETELSEFIEKVNTLAREAVYNVFTFLMVAVLSGYKLAYEKCENDTVALKFTNV